MKSKKLLAMLMAMVMSLAVAVPAMADDNISTATGTASSTVQAKSVTGSAVGYVTDVQVTVTWTATEGSYYEHAATYTWDADYQSYTKKAPGYTEKAAPAMEITLTNNSDVYENYEISYSKTNNAFTEAPEGDSKTTGTLASYTAVNAIIPQNTGTTTVNSNMSGKNTATYIGTFTATLGSLNLSNEASEVGTYTVTLSKPEKNQLTYALTATTQLSAKGLLDTESSVQTYTDDQGKTCYAYNGYISATAYATWYDAMAFVQMLNENGVEPSDSDIKGTSGGYWRLLSSQADAQAWAGATTDATSGFVGVSCLWASVESEGNTDGAYNWLCSLGGWNDRGKAGSDSISGFVVVWAQN